MNLLLDTLSTPKTFLFWLKSHPAEAIVGQARSSNGCPLANFLFAQGFCHCEVMTGNVGARFEQDFYWLSDRPQLRTENRQMPGWASLFVAIVDEETTRAVSALMAIRALAEAVEVAELPRRTAA